MQHKNITVQFESSSVVSFQIILYCCEFSGC